MRLDPVRMAVAALGLGPNIALAPFLSPPPDRTRRAELRPRSLSTFSTTGLWRTTMPAGAS